MNRVILTGRISTDLELRYTTNNFAVMQFNLATNRPVTRDGERVTDFITCVVWGKQAENLQKYQSKGSLIAVQGSFRVDAYDKSDGTRGYKSYVSVNEVEFLGTKKETTEAQESTTEKKSNEEILKEVLENDPYAEFGEIIQLDDNDLPF